jgi:hypothetical protein
MQELMVYAGHLDCYEKCNEIKDKFTSVKVSAAQVYRVTDIYGEQIGKITDPSERTLTVVKKEESLYVEADGSMIFTRDDDWKEVKVGRVFKSGDCIRLKEKPSQISHSQYMAHLGDSKTFTRQMEELIESYGVTDNRLVFISDGAPWIRNWVEDAFSNAISVLDYFHASEHLYNFAKEYFKEEGREKEKKKWVKQQENLLLNSKVVTVIKNIGTLIEKDGGTDKKNAAQKLIDYYKSNQDRMDYKMYKKIGSGVIGSGAIESAHRTVVQKRMKLSGQRWSKRGAQNMLNLRVVSMNKRWDKIITLAKTNFKQTTQKAKI